MRVLGAESAADPTAVEAEVRRQMAERQAAHDDRWGGRRGGDGMGGETEQRF
jgi:U4/U6 small nuclear ribonucleoprotein PRP3